MKYKLNFIIISDDIETKRNDKIESILSGIQNITSDHPISIPDKTTPIIIENIKYEINKQEIIFQIEDGEYYYITNIYIESLESKQRREIEKQKCELEKIKRAFDNRPMAW